MSRHTKILSREHRLLRALCASQHSRSVLLRYWFVICAEAALLYLMFRLIIWYLSGDTLWSVLAPLLVYVCTVLGIVVWAVGFCRRVLVRYERSLRCMRNGSIVGSLRRRFGVGSRPRWALEYDGLVVPRPRFSESFVFVVIYLGAFVVSFVGFDFASRAVGPVVGCVVFLFLGVAYDWIFFRRNRGVAAGLLTGFVHDVRVESGRCGRCGYDVRGVALGGVCPECGHPVHPETAGLGGGQERGG